VAILVLLLGAILGRYFKVFVLVPAHTLILATALVTSTDIEHDLLRSFEFAVLIISLQIGYVSGLLSAPSQN
jgi:hypothetical protein